MLNIGDSFKIRNAHEYRDVSPETIYTVAGVWSNSYSFIDDVEELNIVSYNDTIPYVKEIEFNLSHIDLEIENMERKILDLNAKIETLKLARKILQKQQ